MAGKKSSGGSKSGGGKGVHHRSAITGRYVKASTAKRSPKTTVTERNK